MRQPLKTLSTSRKFLILIGLFSALFIFDSWLLFQRTRGMELYDELHHQLSVLTTDVVRLEYVLDISVITRGFEDKRSGALDADIENIDRSLNAVARQEYADLFSDSPEFFEIRDAMLDGWRTIKGELARLGNAGSEEEVLLIHNVVDMNTFILSENASRLMEFVQEQKRIFFEDRVQVLFSVLGFSFIVALVAGFVFYKRGIAPVERFFDAANRFFKSGFSDGLDGEFPGEMGELARSINEACDRTKSTFSAMEDRSRKLREELGNRLKELESLNIVAAMVGSSLSQYEVFMRAIVEVLDSTGAFGGAVYLREGEMLKLKVSKGFSNTFFYKGGEFPLKERLVNDEEESRKPLLFDSIDGYPDGRFKSVLVSEGVRALASIPILHGDKVKGFLDVAFKDGSGFDGHLAFLEALAANLGVAVGYSELFCREHATRIFLERTIQQTPFGLAVFDRQGLCAMANSAFKNFVGGGDLTDFVGNYNIFEDEEFERQGLLDMIKKSYNGRIMEFTIEYRNRYLGGDKMTRFRVKSYPLYDAGGNIPNVALFFDEITSNQVT